MDNNKKFTSLHDDPNMVWSCFRENSICHKCLNFIHRPDGNEFCDVRINDPEDMSIEDIEKVQQTNKCEYFIQKS